MTDKEDFNLISENIAAMENPKEKVLHNLAETIQDLQNKKGSTAETSRDGTRTYNMPNRGRKKGIDFSMKPMELKQYLDKRVVKQDSAKLMIATKVCTHYNSIRYRQEKGEDPMADVDNIKPNILLLGPTGVGKTFIIKHIANKLDVPFIKADATKFSETGYVGGDVEDLVRNLVKEANNDIEKAQYGIIYIDEVDKIASAGRGSNTRDVSGTGVQRGLLKIIEETEIDLNSKMDVPSQISMAHEYQKTGVIKERKINTKNILFVFSGAFNGLDDIIKKRTLNKCSMGFGGEVHSKDDVVDYLADVTPADLREYGFESEFISRIPIISVLERLNEDDLVTILKNPTCSIIRKKKTDFASYGINLEFSDDSFQYFSKEATSHGTGARGLVTVIDNALLFYEAKLPDSGITSLHVTKDMVDRIIDPNDIIYQAVSDASFKAYEDKIKSEYGISLNFDTAARKLIWDGAQKANVHVYEFCAGKFSDIEDAFNLIANKNPEKVITITEKAVENLNDYIGQLIMQEYKE
ncbi:MAG: AAA family ATPase [Nanoarchaeota archaeon]|nr:AAA family ATPase [Nanoarchaeota archaeon]